MYAENPIVTNKNATEYSVFRFATEASTLGIRPGRTYRQLQTTLGNGLNFLMVSDDPEGVQYRQHLGNITLTVFND